MQHPLLYEINTRCWLRALSDKHGRNVTLSTIPPSELDSWVAQGFTHVWLMGVWTTGPRSRAVALGHPELQRCYSQILPGWREKDVPGSPYAIADYRVPSELGGEAGLSECRRALAERGLKLVLDFVPNHVGLDHAWVRERPEFFVQAPEQRPDFFRQETGQGAFWLAHGKDPYFPGWTDTVQLDYRKPAVRAAMTGLLTSVAARCDGVRCDMAMLLLNEIFAKTWGQFPPKENSPAAPSNQKGSDGSGSKEFWAEAIAEVRAKYPDFMFLAEVYWGLEGRLQRLGFDYTYDKTLYERLLGRDGAGVQAHLLGQGTEGIARGAHFLENHDEPRIAPILPLPEHRAAALILLGLPGMRFLHDGELTGAATKLPVQLGRGPVEPIQPAVSAMYSRLLNALRRTAIGRGQAEVLRPRATTPDDSSFQNFVLAQWQVKDGEFELAVINFAPQRSRCLAPITARGVAGREWTMRDLLGDELYRRDGTEMAGRGLYLELPPWGAQIFQFS